MYAQPSRKSASLFSKIPNPKVVIPSVVLALALLAFFAVKYIGSKDVIGGVEPVVKPSAIDFPLPDNGSRQEDKPVEPPKEDDPLLKNIDSKPKPEEVNSVEKPHALDNLLGNGNGNVSHDLSSDQENPITQDTVLTPAVRPQTSVEQYLDFVNQLRSINKGVTDLNNKFVGTQFETTVFIEQQEKLNALEKENSRMKTLLGVKDKNPGKIQELLAEAQANVDILNGENKRLSESNISLRKMVRELNEMVGMAKLPNTATPAQKEAVKKAVTNDVFDDWKISAISKDEVVFVNKSTGDVMARKAGSTYKGVKIMRIDMDKKLVQTSEGSLSAK